MRDLRINRQPIRHIRQLNRIVIARDHGGVIRRGQADIPAVRAQLEIGVQLLPRHRAIFRRGEDEQISPRRNRISRHAPLVQNRCIVSQEITIEVQIVIRGIVDFDPVGGSSIGVIDCVVVGGHELVDDRSDGHQQPHLQRLETGAQGISAAAPL